MSYYKKRKRKSLSKRKAEIHHFIRRAKQRYGMELNKQDVKRIVNKIQSGASKVLKKQSLRVAIHQVTYQGTSMIVAYDKNRSVPITALPERN